MDAIKQWKQNNSPYYEGVMLYASFPTHNKMLLKNFQKKETPQLHEKLKYELSKFETQVPKVKINKVYADFSKDHSKSVETIVKVSKNDVVKYIEQQESIHLNKQALYFHELPAELRPVLLKANSLFKEMCFLKVELNDLPPEAESKSLELQLIISNKQHENALCWKKLDYWQTHKVVPKEAKCEFEQLSPAKLLRKEQLLFASISKMKKRLDENKEHLKLAHGVNEVNKLQRNISKQESSLIAKNEELLTIKRLINGN